MNKQNRRRVWVGIALLLIALLFLLLFVHHFGPKANDALAQKQLKIIQSAPWPDAMVKLDSSTCIGRLESDGTFGIWAGIAIKTDLTSLDVKEIVQAMAGLESAEILPYELSRANRLKFTGIQKELSDEETEKCFLIGLTVNPATSLDKRNQE